MPAPLEHDRVGRKIVAQPHHDGAEIDAAGLLGRLLGPGEIVGMRGLRPGAPLDLVGRLQAFGGGREGGRRRMDREMRLVDAAELLGARMHVHEGHLRARNVEQRVALRRHLAEPAADQQHEVGLLDARDQLRVRPDAEIARVAGMQRVEQRAAPERGRDRQREALGEAGDRRVRGRPTSGCRRAA